MAVKSQKETTAGNLFEPVFAIFVGTHLLEGRAPKETDIGQMLKSFGARASGNSGTTLTKIINRTELQGKGKADKSNLTIHLVLKPIERDILTGRKKYPEELENLIQQGIKAIPSHPKFKEVLAKKDVLLGNTTHEVLNFHVDSSGYFSDGKADVVVTIDFKDAKGRHLYKNKFEFSLKTKAARFGKDKFDKAIDRLGDYFGMKDLVTGTEKDTFARWQTFQKRFVEQYNKNPKSTETLKKWMKIHIYGNSPSNLEVIKIPHLKIKEKHLRSTEDVFDKNLKEYTKITAAPSGDTQINFYIPGDTRKAFVFGYNKSGQVNLEYGVGPAVEDLMFEPFVTKEDEGLIEWEKESFEAQKDDFDHTVRQFMPPKMPGAARMIKINMEYLKKRYEKARVEPLSSTVWRALEHSESFSTKNWQDVVKAAQRLDLEEKPDAVKDEILGNLVRAPIILQYGSNKFYLVSGELRLMVARSLNVTPKVIILKTDW